MDQGPRGFSLTTLCQAISLHQQYTLIAYRCLLVEQGDPYDATPVQPISPYINAGDFQHFLPPVNYGIHEFITRTREIIIAFALLASIPQAQDKWIKTPGTILQVTFTGHRT
jgi:hypothetical protein